MKKVIYLIFLLGFVSIVSCKKEYHCTCTFNNQVVFTKDLGEQVLKNANSQCSAYDTSVTGETWNCTVY